MSCMIVQGYPCLDLILRVSTFYMGTDSVHLVVKGYKNSAFLPANICVIFLAKFIGQQCVCIWLYSVCG